VVTALDFDHSLSASQRLFEMFDDGDWLYPPDCLADLVERLDQLPFVTEAAMRHAAAKDGLDATPQRLGQAAMLLQEELGLETVQGHELELTDEDVAIGKAQAAWLEAELDKHRTQFSLVRYQKRIPPAKAGG
jgi:hypothetical protein